MARTLTVFAICGCFAALSAGARIASAQSEDGPPLYFDSSSSNSEDAAGPALASPSDSENTGDHSSANNSRSNRAYNGSQSQGYSANNNDYSRNAKSQQSYGPNGQPTYQSNGQLKNQTGDRRSGGSDNRPTNSNAQSHWGGYQPGYQQAPPENSTSNNNGNSWSNNNGQNRTNNNSVRGPWPGETGYRQSGDMQASDEQSQSRSQYNRGQSNNQQAGNWQQNRAPSGNVSASYMPSDDSRRQAQPGTTSVMSNNSSWSGNQGYGSSNYRNNYSSSRFAQNTLPSPMPMQNSAVGSPYSSNSTAPRRPMVTPNAVYIDGNAPGEAIGPGHMTYGKPQTGVMMEPALNDSGEIVGQGQGGPEAMMEGGPMEGEPQMGCNGDGFTNPYCNSCNGCGGGCGGPSCGGNCCNSGCNDCCDDDDCGFGDGHQPYGRPWILAPFDWFAGELTSCHRGWWWAEDLTVFAGAQNFKNIADGGVTPSFGFQEGVNWGFPVFPDFGLSGQVGYMATQSELENPIGSRQQSFITAGVFHRPWCDQCWDAGVVFDWLHDDFFGAPFDVGQVRGQIGYQWNRRNEFGFWFGQNVMQTSDFQTLNQYDFYYRHQFCRGGDLRFWGGFTGGNSSHVSGGLFGADFEVPLAKRFAIDGGFNYFIPSDSAGNGGLREETWGIGCNLVWYLGGTAECYTPYRPLFDVANNNSLMTILH
jgi:hypothetical protein